MGIEKLGELKKLLIAQDDFDQIWEYFTKYFDEDAEFMAIVPKIVANHEIADLVAAAGATVLRDEGEEVHLPLESQTAAVNFAEESFIHGVAVLQGHMIRFFYFDDLDVGMVCMNLGDHFRLGRLSSRTVPIRVSIFQSED